jgi:hypothetical protein
MTDADRAKERRRLAEIYASMVDGELEKIADDGANLSDVARDALAAEISKRKLAVSLPPVAAVDAESPEPPKIVTIRKFLNVPDALLAKGLLESAGIECFLADENLVRLDWFWSNAIGGVKLWVREEDAPAAISILDQGPQEGAGSTEAGNQKRSECPNCHSSDVTFRGLKRRAAYASLAIGVPVPFRHIAWKCRACGHVWGDEDSEEAP